MGSGLTIPLNQANGGSRGFGTIDELIAIAASASSSSTTNLLQTNSWPTGLSWYVSVAPGGVANFSIGDASSSTRFATGISAVAGTSGYVPIFAASLLSADDELIMYDDDPVVDPPLGTVKITPNATPSDALGRIRIVIHYENSMIPTS